MQLIVTYTLCHHYSKAEHLPIYYSSISIRTLAPEETQETRDVLFLLGYSVFASSIIVVPLSSTDW